MHVKDEWSEEAKVVVDGSNVLVDGSNVLVSFSQGQLGKSSKSMDIIFCKLKKAQKTRI